MLCFNQVSFVQRCRQVATPLTIMAAASMALTTASVFAADAPGYNDEIRPILADMCFTCHGPDSAARKADLRIDQRDAAIAAGTIVPGKPDESELINRIMTDDAELVMPPLETKKKLTEQQKQLLRQWIEQGAEYQRHWSFIPPQKSDPPQVVNTAWPKNEIDRFILSRLEAKQLSPAAPADARTLFRRMHLDITGLPPEPDQISAFEADYNSRGDAALSDWIDRLMDSPAWGEHRARYWMDAARYGDTHGLHFD
ncbi:MAG: DUF1549 domain-containing protein, partial [Planctomycetaceae bacterium]|nr:DUF1549 domain-containing protein [Planctomycetaceae bacterium]